jgi:hypothetical protein
MSVTVVPKRTDHEPQHHRTYEQLAADAVFDNRAVCDECFARVRTDDGRRDFRGERGFDVEEKDAYGAIEAYELRTTCGDCGSIGCGPIEATLSIQQAVGRVPALARRLEEAGHDPHVEAMYYIVREGKRREQLAGHDDDLFELAATVGLREGTVD